jgi:hypothetical protein
MPPVIIPYLASLMTVRASWRGLAPRTWAACLMMGFTLTMAVWDREVTMGKARMNWAMIMAPGV